MKRLTARVENYQDQQGQTKGKYVDIGALGMSQAGKEYILLDPSVNLAGVLFKQNLMAHGEGKPPNKNVMVSVFDNSQQQWQQPQQQNNQQPVQQQQNQEIPRTDSEAFHDDQDIPFLSHERFLL